MTFVNRRVRGRESFHSIPVRVLHHFAFFATHNLGRGWKSLKVCFYIAVALSRYPYSTASAGQMYVCSDNVSRQTRNRFGVQFQCRWWQVFFNLILPLKHWKLKDIRVFFGDFIAIWRAQKIWIVLFFTILLHYLEFSLDNRCWHNLQSCRE